MNRLIAFLILLAPLAMLAAPTIETNSVKESGGDYSTLTSWENGEDDTGNLTTRDVISVAEISGTWTIADTNAFSIAGWTTDATRYIEIRAIGDSRHAGKWTTTAYRLTPNDAASISVTEEFVRIYGLQIAALNITADRILVNFSIAYPNDIRMASCIFTGTSAENGDAIFALYTSDADLNLTAWNCIGFNCTSVDNADGYFIYMGNGTNVFYNMTGFKNYRDYSHGASGTASMYNSISQDVLLAGAEWIGTWGGDYNCTDGATDVPGANSITNEVPFVSEVAGSEDLHLQATATAVIDVTTDQSSGLFADDIDGVTRAGAWCIGADEYVAPPAGAAVRVKTLRLRR